VRRELQVTRHLIAALVAVIVVMIPTVTVWVYVSTSAIYAPLP